MIKTLTTGRGFFLQAAAATKWQRPQTFQLLLDSNSSTKLLIAPKIKYVYSKAAQSQISNIIAKQVRNGQSSNTYAKEISFKRIYNTELSLSNKKSTQTSPPPPPPPPSSGSKSIFVRFKDAYKQHGKVLIYCHIVLCCGWIVSFYFVAKSGYNLSSLLTILEMLHIFSKETSESILKSIDTFDLEKFVRESYARFVLPEAAIKWLGAHITGETLKYIVTAIFLYKIFTPLRYLLTLGTTQVLIGAFKRRGVIPVKPPPGSSIKDLYAEQKQEINRSIKRQRERYNNTRMGRFLRQKNAYYLSKITKNNKK